MRRLVVTGLPCPPEVWEEFLGKRKDQKIVSIYDVFENSSSSDLRIMSRYVTSQIETFRPQSIIAHDMGVPLTLLSLLRLRKKRSPLVPSLTLFNGAVRRVNFLKANHPFRIQIMSTRRAIAEIERKGGKVDLRLKKHYGRIRAMFRYIIAFRLAEKLYEKFGIDEILGVPDRFAIKCPVQILASSNDPYIPFEAIEQLKHDCSAERLIELDYGHFPYNSPSSTIIPLIEEFESSTVQKLDSFHTPLKPKDRGPQIALELH